MRSWFGVAFMLLAGLFLLGMGNMEQSEKPGGIPLPDQEISASITDNEGLTLNLTQFSINGQTFLPGKLGAGKVAIPLSQIRVIYLSADPKGSAAKVEMADHSQLQLLLEKGIMVYGKIKYGTYRVSVDHLKKIEVSSFGERKKGPDRY
jgi:hypothetical protein